MGKPNLPAPSLAARPVGPLDIITDDALARVSGVRVAFTGAAGGVSEGPYASLNLASHVGDDPRAVAENRALLMSSLDAGSVPLIVPNQVHGSNLVTISSSDARAVERARESAAQGADGIVIESEDVAALLCFADCVPVVIVSPTGRFAVVHAGWRGVIANIAPKAVELMAQLDAPVLGSAREAAAGYNVYVGPHIHAECFETGADVLERFVESFGPECAVDDRHIDLLKALSISLSRVGVDPARIVDAGVCTVCSGGRHYSYRASGGVCGRHGALAFRRMRG